LHLSQKEKSLRQSTEGFFFKQNYPRFFFPAFFAALRLFAMVVAN
jgi:hypothetical protein